MSITDTLDLVLASLQDMKAGNIVALNIQELTSIADYMVIATGTSNRHVQSIARRVTDNLKPQLSTPIHIDADYDSEWVLVDLGDIIVHIMQPLTRDFYALERLWDPQSEAFNRVSR